MEQLFGSIRTVLGDLEPNPEAAKAVVFAAWHRCAGDLIRERTMPISFSGNRLAVAVADKTWQRHLEDLSPQMLVKLNRTLGTGTVRFIEFRIDQRSLDGLRKPVAVESPADTSRLRPALKNAAKSIRDEHLRETFLAAAGVYLGTRSRK